MPKALSILWELVRDEKYPTAARAKTALMFDKALGLRLEDYVACPLDIPANVRALVDERALARKNKDFHSSDVLRDKIELAGFTVEDTVSGPRLRLKR